MRDLLWIAVAVACPLMMILMMRGGHGHGQRHAAGDEHARQDPAAKPSLDELHRRREELDRAIAEREQSERELGV